MKEYDVLMALLTRGSRILNDWIDTIISMAKSGCRVDGEQAKHFKEYYNKGKGSICGVKLTKEDMELILKVNEEAKANKENMSNEKYNEKYLGDDFTFSQLHWVNSDGSGTMMLKDVDVKKFEMLCNYLDRNQYEHNLGRVIHNIKKLNEPDWANTDLVELEVKDLGQFKNLSNLFNVEHIDFLVVNHQNSNGLIFNRKDEDAVATIIKNCKFLSTYEQADLICNHFKNINDRTTSHNQYKDVISRSM